MPKDPQRASGLKLSSSFKASTGLRGRPLCLVLSFTHTLICLRAAGSLWLTPVSPQMMHLLSRCHGLNWVRLKDMSAS